jgi:hypothetical protein
MLYSSPSEFGLHPCSGLEFRGETLGFLPSLERRSIDDGHVKSLPDFAIPTDVVKTVAPGISSVSFEGVTYRIATAGRYEFRFERLDPTHHKLTIVPLEQQLQAIYDVYIQWDLFPPVILDLGGGGGFSYTLGTETGYAEK